MLFVAKLCPSPVRTNNHFIKGKCQSAVRLLLKIGNVVVGFITVMEYWFLTRKGCEKLLQLRAHCYGNIICLEIQIFPPKKWTRTPTIQLLQSSCFAFSFYFRSVSNRVGWLPTFMFSRCFMTLRVRSGFPFLSVCLSVVGFNLY